MATKTVSENVSQRSRFEMIAVLSGGGFCPLPNSSQTISGTSVSNSSKIVNTASELFESQFSQKLLNPRMSNNPKMQFMFLQLQILIRHGGFAGAGDVGGEFGGSLVHDGRAFRSKTQTRKEFL
jgi:hypothetical protein